MNWKRFLSPNLFKVFFIIAVFLTLGLPYSYQLYEFHPAITKGMPLGEALTTTKGDYVPYGGIHYDFRPLWGWNLPSETDRASKTQFTFSIPYFILITLLVYFIACVLSARYGTTDVNSKTPGRLYSRSGIMLLAMIVILWRLVPHILNILGISSERTSVILILIGIISALIVIILGVIGFVKNDKLSSVFNILLAVITIYFGVQSYALLLVIHLL